MNISSPEQRGAIVNLHKTPWKYIPLKWFDEHRNSSSKKLQPDDPLAQRMNWAHHNPTSALEASGLARIKSTDLIRSQVIADSINQKVSFLEALRLINAAHMNGNEHLIFSCESQPWLNKLTNNAHLGGMLRGANVIPQDKLTYNPNEIGFGGELIQCAPASEVRDLMNTLEAQVEKILPYDVCHSQVSRTTIYEQLSAMQYLICLIHPFYEANGRTSEDAMYLLWARRPDLSDLLRFPSFDGSREGLMVKEREIIIREGAKNLLNDFTKTLTRQQWLLPLINIYPDLHDPTIRVFIESCHECRESCLTRKKHIVLPCLRIEQKYNRFLMAAINQLICSISNPDELRQHPVIQKLADNLAKSSTTYTFDS